MPLDLDRLDVIRNEVYAWSVTNFGEHGVGNPLTGMVEELGELSHARLKAAQGIRGSKESHEEAEKDAIADAAIFCLDLLGCMIDSDGRLGDLDEAVFFPEPEDAESFAANPASTKLAYLALVQTAGKAAEVLYDEILDPDPESLWVAKLTIRCTQFLSALSLYSLAREWNFMLILESTWAKVKTRNWRADPAHGGEPTVAASKGVGDPSHPAYHQFMMDNDTEYQSSSFEDGAHASTYVPVASLVSDDPVPNNDLGEPA